MRAGYRIPIAISIPPLAVATLLVASSAVDAQIPGPEFRVNTYTTGTQHRPSVAGSGDKFLVVWEGASAGDVSGILGQRVSEFGVPLGGEFRVNGYTTSTQAAPSVGGAICCNGDFVVAWESLGQDGQGYGIFGQRYSNAGTPLGAEFRVNSYTTSDQRYPRVAADAGAFVVVWESLDQDGDGAGVFGQRYGANGAPMGGEFRVNTSTTGFQGHPALAMTFEGHFVVAWEGESASEEGLGIFGQIYMNTGVPVGAPEFRVNAYTTANQRNPAAACGGSSCAVAWQSEGQDGSGYGIYTRELSLMSGALAPAHRVNTFTDGSQTDPSIATTDFLDSIITWQNDDAQDPQGGISGQFYYHNVGELGSEFRVNTQTSGVQSQPAVGLTSGGFSVLVAWTSDQDPDGSLGVYAEEQSGPWLPVELQNFTVE